MSSNNFKLENSYAYQSYLLARALRKQFFALSRSAGHQLFPEQWFALYFIVNQPGQSQSQLAEHAFEDKPSLSRTLKSMAEKGLIVASKDPSDLRSVRYKATDKGNAVYEDLVSVITEVRKDISLGLDEADYAHYERIVQMLINNIR